MANPLGCAAALASIELFEREDRLGQVEAIEQQLREQLAPCRRLDGVRDVRVMGATGVVELEEQVPDKIWLNQRFIEEGVWIRPLKNVVYVMPPMVISTQELTTLTAAMVKVITEYTQRKITA